MAWQGAVASAAQIAAKAAKKPIGRNLAAKAIRTAVKAISFPGGRPRRPNAVF
jgi:hypothetical protein